MSRGRVNSGSQVAISSALTVGDGEVSLSSKRKVNYYQGVYD